MKNSKVAKLKAERAKQFRLASQQRQDEIKDVLVDLHNFINGQEKLDWDGLMEQIKAIKPIVNISNDLSEIEQAIKSIKIESPDLVKVKDLESLIKAVKANKPIEPKLDVQPIVKAIIQLRERIEEKTVDQSPSEFAPVRRVVKVGNRLIFDDNMTQTIGGRGGGGGQTALVLGTALVSSSNPLPVDLTDTEITVEQDLPSTAVVTSVADSATNQTLLALNASRKKARIYNNSSSTLYVKEGTTASATDFTVALYQDDYFETTYTGRIDGIWSSNSTGAALITEES